MGKSMLEAWELMYNSVANLFTLHMTTRTSVADLEEVVLIQWWGRTYI